MRVCLTNTHQAHWPSARPPLHVRQPFKRPGSIHTPFRPSFPSPLPLPSLSPPSPLPLASLSPSSRLPLNFLSPSSQLPLPSLSHSSPLPLPFLSPPSPLSPSQPIPVVVVHQQPSGSVACHPSHFMHRNLRHTRQRNAVVYFIGPDSDECVEMARELDIVLDPVIGYQDVVGWFSANLGDPVSYQVRWFILKAFMERHAFPRIFFLDSDVILFANVTELATMLFSRVHLVVSQRWPRYDVRSRV
ncbi:unnamed protein product [Closterium sp. NIES-53]